MGELIHIRRYEPGEEPALFDIFYTAIHLVASQVYTAAQIQAWTQRNSDAALWRNKNART
jgi:putative acetyltransferase